MRAARRFLPWSRATFLFLFVLAPAIYCRAQVSSAWDELVRAFAGKIAAVAGPPAGALLDVRNMSALAPGDVADIRHALESELIRRGYHFVPGPPADQEIRVTLSENLQGLVWVAEIRKGEEVRIAILEIPKPPIESAPRATLKLERKRIWEQSEPILDFALVEDADKRRGTLYILGPDRLRWYGTSNGHIAAQPFFTTVIPRISPRPRDLRGYLLAQDDTVTGFLPGVRCVANACQEASSWLVWARPGETWQIEPAAGRNYFQALRPAEPSAKSSTDFYSFAAAPPELGPLSLLAAMDGTVLLEGEDGSVLSRFDGWGSDIATIRPDCGGGWYVLVGGAGDWTEPDKLQAHEISSLEDLSTGQPLGFSGPILALWTPRDMKSVRVVSRNVETGDYEASTITAACND